MQGLMRTVSLVMVLVDLGTGAAPPDDVLVDIPAHPLGCLNAALISVAALADAFTTLSADEKQLVSQIQGRTYANIFGLVERFINAKVLELSEDHWFGDQIALEALIGREPTSEELAEKLGMPLERVHKVLKLTKEPLSIETPIGDEEDGRLGDLIETRTRCNRSMLPSGRTCARLLPACSPRSPRGKSASCECASASV
jgi:hypothetical protein